MKTENSYQLKEELKKYNGGSIKKIFKKNGIKLNINNKGNIGQGFETVLGIERSSRLKDGENFELKTYSSGLDIKSRY